MSYQPGTTTDSRLATENKERESLSAAGKQQLRKASREISHTLSKQADEAKSKIRDSAKAQKSEVVTQMNSVNDALRKTAANLDNPRLEDSLEQLAGKVETAADRLADAEITDMVQAVDRMARENSTLFALGTFALGLSLARFLKATPVEPVQPAPMVATTNPRLSQPLTPSEVTTHDHS